MKTGGIFDLGGRVAIVTGGFVGLGRRVAEGLVEMSVNRVTGHVLVVDGGPSA
jgi:hypothetical protein